MDEFVDQRNLIIIHDNDDGKPRPPEVRIERMCFDSSTIFGQINPSTRNNLDWRCGFVLDTIVAENHRYT